VDYTTQTKIHCPRVLTIRSTAMDSGMDPCPLMMSIPFSVKDLSSDWSLLLTG
jgi:hypothetical protein